MLQKFPSVTTREVFQSVNQAHIRIIDTRAVDFYNGWPMKEGQRGGHIPTAKSLSVKWTYYIDWIEIVRSKKILPEHRIILYGSDMESLQKVGQMFYKAGYPSVYFYEKFANEWLPNQEMPLDKLSRFRQLVPPEWLQQQIVAKKSGEQQKLVVCHAHYQNRADYENGHIPGAIALDTNWLESESTWNRRTPQELSQQLAALGITYDTTVVLYGRFSYPRKADPYPGSSAGHLGAIRCAVIMLYAGVQDVKVLNGGIQSWEDADLDISIEDYNPSPVPSFKARIPQHPDIFIDTPQAKEILAHPNEKLVSVRSWDEFIGNSSGYHYISQKGRIPGAVFGNCGSDAYHMENYRNLDHSVREAQEIEHMLAAEGIAPGPRTAFYCGTGWRGAEAFFNLWLMGWHNIAVYDGGWLEWSNDPANPIETGIPTPATQKTISIY